MVCFLVVLSGIGIVNAETLTGTIGSSGTQSVNYSVVTGGSVSSALPNLYFNDIQNSGGTTALIFYPYTPSDAITSFTFDAGAPTGATTPIGVAYGSQIIANGTIGYARVFNGTGTELYAYLYIVFDSWDVTGLTGDLELVTTFNRSALWNPRTGSVGGNPPSGSPTFYYSVSYHGLSGYHIHNKNSGLIHEYSATKPSGIGITGQVVKTVDGIPWSSKIFITDEDFTILSSEGAYSTTNYNFSTYENQIYISCLSPESVWFNTSLLFGVTPTPTPTATPTTAPTIAPGYVRTSVETIDGTTGNTIHGSNIFLYDVEGSTWSNSSSDGDGIHYIDTLPYHTINAYATFTAFAGEYTDASALGLPTGYYGGFTYYLSMFPPALSPGEGNVNLYVTVLDADTYDIIRDASVQVRLPTGAVQGGSTGTSGTEIFVVPNSTVINIAAAKAGYVGSNTVINSGIGTTASATVYMHKAVITTTPTSTIPAGGVTPAVTADPNDPSITGSTNAKGQEMLNWLAMNGMDLVQLCFLVTVLALLGIKFGK